MIGRLALIEVAAYNMAAEIGWLRTLLAADVHHLWTARAEGAAGRRVHRAGNVAAERLAILVKLRVGDRDGVHERTRVRLSLIHIF